MAVTGSPGPSSLESNLSTSPSLPSDARARTTRPSYSTSISENGSNPSCQITVLPEMTAVSPLVGSFYPTRQSATVGSSSSQSEWHGKEAGPLPEKVGEIGYVASAEPTVAPGPVARSLASTQNTVDDDLSTNLQPLRSMRTGSSWNPAPAGSSPYAEHSRGSAAKPSEKIPARKMLLRPFLLVFLGLVVLIITLVSFIQVQERTINSNNKKNQTASNNTDVFLDLENHTGNHSTNSSDASSGGNTSSNNASFVYLGTIFIVALLIEFWIFVGTLRRLYHRLGLWIDQEYPLLLPDLSDPEAATPLTPVLPTWARILAIKPQAVRPPLLPPYIAVLNMIRTGGRSETNLEGTGDVEDGEVIRTLAIGQGQAAPAFNGEEFQKSTIILSGPPKRSSVLSIPVSVRSSGGLLRKLSRSLTGRFSSRNSTTTHENQANSSSQIP